MTDQELEHYGILGMKWGVRKKRAPLEKKRAPRDYTEDVNRLAWKAEKIRRRATKKLAKRVIADRKKGITETHEKPDQWIKAIKIEKKAQALIDKMIPELANVPWSDLEKQGIYTDIKYWKTPKWA